MTEGQEGAVIQNQLKRHRVQGWGAGSWVGGIRAAIVEAEIEEEVEDRQPNLTRDEGTRVHIEENITMLEGQVGNVEVHASMNNSATIDGIMNVPIVVVHGDSEGANPGIENLRYTYN